MGIDEERPDGAVRRGVAARIGIALLNLLSPGLGLQRLSQPLWLFYAAWLLALDAGLLAIFALVRDMSFRGMGLVMSAYLVAVLAAFIASIWQSWRHSAVVAPSPPWWSRWYGLLLSWAVVAALANLASVALHSFYKTYYIPSQAMIPALRVGDRLLADMRPGELKRGDVVIVGTERNDYVKRVAALPGDRIAMRGGIIFINEVAVPQTPAGHEMVNDVGPPVEGVISIERLPGEAHSHLVIDTGYSDGDNVAPVLMGPNQYYLLGDNRDHSADSRYPASMMGLGVVDRARIKGRVLFRYWRKGVGLVGANL